MFASWKLARVAGIDLYLHPTFLLLLLFVGLTQGGLGAMLLFAAIFGCVVLHELGHALTARAYGIGTRDITLYPIGGVARLDRMPRSPGAELMITLAGPATNLAIAAALLPLIVVAGGPMTDLGHFLGNLQLVNLLMAGFNLIPAFPMDGGRILRALLTLPLGRYRATEIAAGLGRAMAILLPLGFLMAGWFNVLHLVLAVFLWNAAGAERQAVRAEFGKPSSFGFPRFSGAERVRPRSGDVWYEPPGYRWVSRRPGVWQLVPIPVATGDSPVERHPMALTPIVELGVAEAYAILQDRLGQTDLPPLDAIENEDWGRDSLLSRLAALSDETLATLGLQRADHPAEDGTPA